MKKLWIPSVLTLVFFLAVSVFSGYPVRATAASDDSDPYLNALLRNHSAAASASLLARHGRDPQFGLLQQQVDENTRQLAVYVGERLGNDAGEELKTLWQRHIDYLGMYTDAVRDGDEGSRQAAEQGLEDMANRLSGYFSGYRGVPEENLRTLLKNHIENEKAIVSARASGNEAEVQNLMRAGSGMMERAASLISPYLSTTQPGEVQAKQAGLLPVTGGNEVYDNTAYYPQTAVYPQTYPQTNPYPNYYPAQVPQTPSGAAPWQLFYYRGGYYTQQQINTMRGYVNPPYVDAYGRSFDSPWEWEYLAGQYYTRDQIAAMRGAPLYNSPATYVPAAGSAQTAVPSGQLSYYNGGYYTQEQIEAMRRTQAYQAASVPPAQTQIYNCPSYQADP